MESLNQIFEKYKTELINYSEAKNTIPGKLKWETYKSEIHAAFASEVDKECTRLNRQENISSDLLKEYANKLMGDLRRI